MAIEAPSPQVSVSISERGRAKDKQSKGGKLLRKDKDTVERRCHMCEFPSL
jgi:hypothetical protein